MNEVTVVYTVNAASLLSDCLGENKQDLCMPVVVREHAGHSSATREREHINLTGYFISML